MRQHDENAMARAVEGNDPLSTRTNRRGTIDVLQQHCLAAPVALSIVLGDAVAHATRIGGPYFRRLDGHVSLCCLSCINERVLHFEYDIIPAHVNNLFVLCLVSVSLFLFASRN